MPVLASAICPVMSPCRQNTSACKHILELIIGTDIVERESCALTVWEGGCIVLGYTGICYLRIQCLLFIGLNSNFKFDFSVVSNIAAIPYSVQQKLHFSFKDGAGRLVKQDRYYHTDVCLVFIFFFFYEIWFHLYFVALGWNVMSDSEAQLVIDRVDVLTVLPPLPSQYCRYSGSK